MDAWDRWWKKVQVIPGGCWVWTGGKFSNGYGCFYVGGHPRRNALAHKWGYEHFVGPVPEGLDLDHTCHDPETCPGGDTCPHRACVNPSHLKPATRSENVTRGVGRGHPTHCKNGHPLKGDNVYDAGDGKRRCRACRLDANRAIRARVKADPERLAELRAADAAAARERRRIQRGGAVAAVNGEKTHCPNGHAYDGDNLVIDSSGARRCRTCMREANRRAYLKRKQTI